MSGLNVLFASMIGIVYIFLIVTIAVMTFRKGHWILGLIGFLMPLFWVIGAIIGPTARKRSSYVAL
jgi:hypothetical protein